MAPSTRQARKRRVVDSPSSDEEISVSQVKTESTSTGEVTSGHEARSSSPASSTSTLSSPPASPSISTKHVTKDGDEMMMAALSFKRESALAAMQEVLTTTTTQTNESPGKLERSDGVRGAQDAAHPELSIPIAAPAQNTKDAPVEQGDQMTDTAEPIGMRIVTSTPEVAPTAIISQDERASEFEAEAAKRRTESREFRESNGELTHGAANAGSDSDTNITFNGSDSDTNITFNGSDSDTNITFNGDRSLSNHTNEADLSGSNSLAKVNGDQSAESKSESQMNKEHQEEEVPALPSAKEPGEAVKDETTVPALEDGQIKMPTSTNQTELVGPDQNAVAMPLQDAQHAKHREPLLAEQVSKAVAKCERKSFNKGDMAVIFDFEDLSKTLLMSSDAVFRASKVLQELSAHHDTSENVRYAFLLQAANDEAGMPVLSSLSLTQTLEQLSGSGVQSYLLARKKASEVEPEPEDVEEDANASGPPPTNWVKAYEAFFSIIVGVPFRRIFHSNAATALTQIEAVIAVGKQLDALPALASTFNELVISYIENQTLWPAVAKEAASWLLVGLTRESSLVYDEAFKHVAGRFPDWPWEKPIDSIPKQVYNAVEAKSAALRYRRYHVDQKLMPLTIPTEVKIKSRPGAKQMGGVDQQKLIFRHTLQLWRDWVCEHIRNLDDQDDREGDGSPPVGAFCKHEKGECLTVAGFYRVISRGGDSYLPADEVVANWNQDLDFHEATIRATLQRLKSKASEIVKDLVVSTVKESNAKLDYLTCIEIESEDVPWETFKDEEVQDEDEFWR